MKIFCCTMILFATTLCVMATDARPLEGYVIAIPEGALPAEQTAARELSDFLGRITGVPFPVVSETQARGKAIFVGQSPKIAKLAGGIDFATLGADAIILKKIPEGFIVSGDRPRGTLYAAYTLLEDQFGVRFWSPTETFVPDNPQATLPDIDICYTPPFFSREYFSMAMRKNPVFAARRKINGHFPPITEEYGGHLPILDWCHTFRLFDISEHPEWGSLFDGKRTANTVDGGQLCLSNQALRRAYLAFVRQRLRQHPGTEVISISQNDVARPCQCRTCTEMKAHNGWNETDMLLDFVNNIAISLKDEFPDLKIETLSYQYTKAPPLKLHAAPNVIVRFCTPMGMMRPLSEDAEFMARLNGWAGKADSLYIWNYVSNFQGWLLPDANLFALGKNLRLFRDNHARAIFEQGDSQTRTGDFLVLRGWLESRLLWNPDQDVRTLIDDFCHLYYGPAAPLILQYFEVLQQALSQPEVESGLQLNCDLWLKPQTLNALLGIMDEAVAKAKGTAYEQRVLQASMPIHYALLLSEATTSPEMRKRWGWSDTVLAARWARICQVTQTLGGETHYRENQPYANLFRWMERRYNPKYASTDLPEEVGIVDKFHILDLRSDDLKVYYKDKGTQVVKDGNTTSGIAVRLNGDQSGWAVQFNPRWDSVMSWFLHAPAVTVYVRLRKEAKPDKQSEAPALLMSTQPQEKWPRASWSANQLPEQYQWLKLGTGKLAKGQYIYLAPVPNPAIQHIFIDRILLVFQ